MAMLQEQQFLDSANALEQMADVEKSPAISKSYRDRAAELRVQNRNTYIHWSRWCRQYLVLDKIIMNNQTPSFNGGFVGLGQVLEHVVSSRSAKRQAAELMRSALSDGTRFNATDKRPSGPRIVRLEAIATARRKVVLALRKEAEAKTVLSKSHSQRGS